MYFQKINPTKSSWWFGTMTLMNNENVSIIVVRQPLLVQALIPLAQKWHGNLVKGVADVDQGILALGGDWHMDANNVLIADGSQQKHVWGFNIYPDERGDAAIEYISLINIRPAQGNRDMEIQDTDLRTTVRTLVSRLIPELFV